MAVFCARAVSSVSSELAAAAAAEEEAGAADIVMNSI